MTVFGLTDKGVVRQKNEDSFYFGKVGEVLVCIVCDGMGGARCGELASSLAISAFLEKLDSIKGDPVLSLVEAVAYANSAVYARSLSDPELSGMGTTLVAALIAGSKALIANIGDSCAYKLTSKSITKLTKDHSVVEDMIDRGDITREEARNHPSKNLITRALGTEPEVVCDIFQADFKRGSTILLCSDGLTNMVDEEAIFSTALKVKSPEILCTSLLNAAISNGATDNVTVIAVRQ